jgi:hypothetical protein
MELAEGCKELAKIILCAGWRDLTNEQLRRIR